MRRIPIFSSIEETGSQPISDMEAKEYGINMLDFADMLKSASKAYNISPNPDDYLFRPHIIFHSGLANRNAVGFPLEELVRWHTEAFVPCYRLWKGCPTFLEHDNQDQLKANGLVADVALVLDDSVGSAGQKVVKIIVLMALDRTKYPELTAKIESGAIDSVSMGAWVEGYTCSRCGADLGNCSHLNVRRNHDFYIDKDRHLIYRMVKGITPFEVNS